MKTDILREKFLNFFKAKKHRIVESDSLVPKDDPTVLFTPAGMNQFKKQFLGEIGDYRRAATSQRCLRTDDLDKVGKTSGHHTFFEMLGNFSFGDYFKKEAIQWAWEFLTEELKISPEKLWVSVYKDDDEAYKIWKDVIGVPEQKIKKLGDKDNFWPAEAKEKGPNGPCGPCSEIFYDFGNDNSVEIWNLVFTQFNRKEGGVLEPLPQKNIDTGMGLERLAAVMQGVQNNFETDLFKPLLKEIVSNHKLQITNEKELAYAIADHVRAVTFSIYDGILPSNDGRGYVVRKIIRKSVLAMRQIGIEKAFLYKLVPVLAETMKVPYPELSGRREDIAQIIQAEEKNFVHILQNSYEIAKENCLKIVDEQKEQILGTADSRNPVISTTTSALAIVAVRLYDTNGIPLDITRKWAEEQGMKVDSIKFYEVSNTKLEEQRQRSRAQGSMKGDVFAATGPKLDVAVTEFVGYKNYETSAKVLAIIKDGKSVTKAGKDEEVKIVLDKTAFYAESGGQVGDTGKLVNGKNIFEILNTQKIGNVFLHIGKVISGSFGEGDKVTVQIDRERRLNIARNHTATHILQAALRKVLGTHVQQQGSLVAEDKFRFDFTHFKGLSREEIFRVEEIANGFIAKSQAVNCKEMPLKEAKKAGALAFFEEKYGENVRVVSIGDISKELCGGTHIDDISKIGLIKIISEGSVASGIRRIEGVTASFAEQFIKDEEQRAMEEAKKRDQLKEQKQQERKRNLELNNNLKDVVPGLINNGVKINGVNVVSSLETGLDMNALRFLADKVKIELKQGVVALGSQDNEQKKVYLVIAVTQDLLSRGLNAGTLINKIAPLIGGSGGGRKDFAQAGGNNPAGIDAALAELKNIISQEKI